MSADSTSTSDLSRIPEEEIRYHLQGLNRERFESLIRNPGFHSRHLVTLLRDDSVESDLIRRIYDDEELRSDYRVKSAMARHPHTPKVIALELLRHLFWRDLLHVMDSLKVNPHVRRTAEYLLGEQIENLTVGEKLALARQANRSAIRLLRRLPDPKIVRILLTNPRLTEEDVLFITTRGESKGPILRAVGRSPRWARRYPIRLALVRNASTPPAVSLPLVSGLLERDLEALTHMSTVHPAVRKTAARVLREGRSNP